MQDRQVVLDHFLHLPRPRRGFGVALWSGQHPVAGPEPPDRLLPSGVSNGVPAAKHEYMLGPGQHGSIARFTVACASVLPAPTGPRSMALGAGGPLASSPRRATEPACRAQDSFGPLRAWFNPRAPRVARSCYPKFSPTPTMRDLGNLPGGQRRNSACGIVLRRPGQLPKPEKSA